MHASVVRYADIRDDWYRGADLMARLIARSERDGTELHGFPASWIPMFLHWGVKWSDPAPPSDYQPLFSDLDSNEIERIATSARNHGQLRTLVEAAASLDPLLADVLHKLDRRKDAVRPVGMRIPLTGWQSYGRREIVEFEERAVKANRKSNDNVVLLPCARKRPYHLSKTHKRLWLGLNSLGVDQKNIDQIVVSSLGVIPSTCWTDPLVLSYDSGVPDIYRILRLMRKFFGLYRYNSVVDCLEFEPYRDCLRIIAQEGLVGTIIDGPSRRVSKLPRP